MSYILRGSARTGLPHMGFTYQRNLDGQWWNQNASVYQPKNESIIGQYLIPAAEDGASGDYTATFSGGNYEGFAKLIQCAGSTMTLNDYQNGVWCGDRVGTNAIGADSLGTPAVALTAGGLDQIANTKPTAAQASNWLVQGLRLLLRRLSIGGTAETDFNAGTLKVLDADNTLLSTHALTTNTGGDTIGPGA